MSASGSATYRVLLVENDAALRSVLGPALEQAGYRLLESPSLAHASGLVTRDGVDVAVVDYWLQARDGRFQADRPHLERLANALPMVLLADEATSLAAVTAGLPLEAVLTRPFDCQALLEAVTRGCARAHRSPLHPTRPDLVYALGE